MKGTIVFLAGLAALSVGVFALNMRLYEVTGQLQSQLNARLAQQTAVYSPPPGTVLPILHGKRLDGSDPAILLQRSAPQLMLIVFDPSNPVSERNWPYWEQLLSQQDITHALIMVTTRAAPPDFLRQHPILQNHMIITQLDPATGEQMHLQAAPQAIYTLDGTVRRVWFGLLSDRDVKEISNTMQDMGYGNDD